MCSCFFSMSRSLSPLFLCVSFAGKCAITIRKRQIDIAADGTARRQSCGVTAAAYHDGGKRLATNDVAIREAFRGGQEMEKHMIYIC